MNRPIDSTQAVGHYPFIFNLEAAISPRGNPSFDKICLKMDRDYIASSFGRNPIAVSLANNHIADYGMQAFEDTLKWLDTNRIRYFGAGRNAGSIVNPAWLQFSGYSIALFGYVCPSTDPLIATEDRPGVVPITYSTIQSEVAHAKALGANRVIVTFHWGAEQVFWPRPEDVSIAHKVIDAGADLIVGHHAHVPQIIEIYRGKLIAYGLGNLAFSRMGILTYSDDENNNRQVSLEQFYWNRVSLGILWNVEDLSWTIKQIVFTDNHVYEVAFDKKKFLKSKINLKLYSFKYGYYSRKNKLFHYVKLLAKNPARFRLCHLRVLMRLIMHAPKA